MKYTKTLLPILFLTFSINLTAFAQSDAVKADAKPITLEDIWLYYKFFPSFPEEFNWMQDDNFYSVMEENAIVKYSIKDRKPVETILDIAELKDPDSGEELNAKSYTFSEDEQMILIKTEVEKIYRHSTYDVCYVYDQNNKALFKIHKGEKVKFPAFSNDGAKIAYIVENNLYYYDFATKKETQFTTDGKNNEVINGGTDWVHEEEFAFTRAFFWSPDNSKIAYYKFDESGVKEFQMAMYGELYPEWYKFKYPKAGEDNAVTTLHFYDLKSGKTVNADIGPEKDQYIPRIKWTAASETLAAMRMNRLQNKLEVLLINSGDGSSRVIMTEESKTYVTEVSDNTWNFLENGKEFIWMSERDGWNHLYHYDLTGKLLKQITTGKWDVTELCAIDEKKGVIYFLSDEDSPTERQLYTIGLDGSKKKKLTSNAGWHEVTFSSNNSFYMDSYSTFATPPMSALFDNAGKEVMGLEDNAELQQKMNEARINDPTFFSFKTKDKVELNGWMIKPVDFDRSKKYPVLMFVYGGPGAQTVKNSFGYFNYFWHQMLADMGYIVVSVDNRGTGGRGADFKKCTYADLGNLETVDQIEAAKYLAKQPYIDGNRIGIWGWSYGGYMTSLCLTKGAEYFKMGIAVAPVTNWRFYDTIYTERYLKTPQLNPAGYDENSPINYADKLKGRYLLIHGMADDNVHYQNSVEWVNSLVNANVQFDSFFYPNKAHSIAGGTTRYHLYKKMTDYIMENL